MDPVLRPNDVMKWFKLRSDAGQNEMAQLIDGVLVGGQVVVGGAESNVAKLLPLLAAKHRVGRLVSIQNAKLLPNQATTFDTAAVLQLIMVARNESFHQTIAQAIDMITKCVEDGNDVSVALQILQENADQVPQL